MCLRAGYLPYINKKDKRVDRFDSKEVKVVWMLLKLGIDILRNINIIMTYNQSINVIFLLSSPCRNSWFKFEYVVINLSIYYFSNPLALACLMNES